jgi:thiol-disulfide isomerase/thioredoxin
MKHAIKGIFVVAIMGGLLYAGWTSYHDFLTQGQRPPEGTIKLNKMDEEGVPEFTIKTLKGDEIALADYNDKVVIVNFWASWCEPCVKEFPSLIRLLDEYKDDVVLIAISADYTMEDLTGFTKAFDVTDIQNFIVVWDKEQEVAKKYGTAVLPESYIVGKDRELIRKVAGVEEWDSKDAMMFFKEVIALNKAGELHKLKAQK